jgi:hypothetical protein
MTALTGKDSTSYRGSEVESSQRQRTRNPIFEETKLGRKEDLEIIGEFIFISASLA